MSDLIEYFVGDQSEDLVGDFIENLVEFSWVSFQGKFFNMYLDSSGLQICA